MMLESESFLMKVARKFGLEKLAWSLRRFHCPVKPDALVLEVGSGGNPYNRSDILFDAYEVTRERHWAPLVSDRPTVLGLVENLPFKDNSFDFVIASHVLEHSIDPERFLNELQRVARAGYIEVPDAFMERINPYKDHRLEITLRDDELLIRKKHDWRYDPELVELYESRAKKWVTSKLIPSRPFEFHVRYYWNNNIRFKVLNPEVDASWTPPSDSYQQNSAKSWRAIVQALARSFSFQRKRSRLPDLNSLLRCPSCHESSFSEQKDGISCNNCKKSFPVKNGIPQLFA